MRKLRRKPVTRRRHDITARCQVVVKRGKVGTGASSPGAAMDRDDQRCRRKKGTITPVDVELQRFSIANDVSESRPSNFWRRRLSEKRLERDWLVTRRCAGKRPRLSSAKGDSQPVR